VVAEEDSRPAVVVVGDQAAVEAEEVFRVAEEALVAEEVVGVGDLI